jgi:alpha-ketoglutarate-dependent taurine dioxygenase
MPSMSERSRRPGNASNSIRLERAGPNAVPRSIIRTHPEPGRWPIYLTPVRAERVLHLDHRDVAAAHAFHGIRFRYRHQWEPGDFVIAVACVFPASGDCRH